MRAFRRGWPRRGRLGLVVAVTVTALGYAGLQEAQAAAPTCSVFWTGKAGDGLWGTAANWSTGKVPGASSDVCLAGALVFVHQGISVHSLRVASDAQLYWEDGPSFVTVQVASDLINDGQLFFDGQNGSNFAISTPSFDSPGSISGYGNGAITSAAFSMSGQFDWAEGTLRLTNAPAQLHGGTLTAGDWAASARGTLVVPEDISQLAGATRVDLVGLGASIQDEAGNNALAPLSAIGPKAALDIEDQATLALSGNLVSSGLVLDGGYGGGDQLTIAGTYTEQPGGSGQLTDSTLTAKSVSIDRGANFGAAGEGTVNGSVINSGLIGGYPMTINGNYMQTSEGSLNRFFGITLTVNGKATLSGALTSAVRRQFPPACGSSFSAVTYSAHSGAFTSLTAGFGMSTGAHAVKVTYLC
jgi:hypothetical protein